MTLSLKSRWISHGSNTAFPGSSVDSPAVEGVNPDLRVHPFFAEMKTISIREFAVGAFNAEMGPVAADPDLPVAAARAVVITLIGDVPRRLVGRH